MDNSDGENPRVASSGSKALLRVEEDPRKDQNRREFESQDNAKHQITSSWPLQPERSLLGKNLGVDASREKVDSLTDWSFIAYLDFTDRIPSVIRTPLDPQSDHGI